MNSRVLKDAPEPNRPFRARKPEIGFGQGRAMQAPRALAGAEKQISMLTVNILINDNRPPFPWFPRLQVRLGAARHALKGISIPL